MGSGGRKASLAAIRLGQGGQQNRQQSSLRERPFILHCGGRGQEDHCANDSTSIPVLKPCHSHDNVMNRHAVSQCGKVQTKGHEVWNLHIKS